MTRFLTLFSLILFLSPAGYAEDSAPHPVCCGEVCYSTHFVQNRAEHFRGLSGREAMAAEEAMLFAYEKEGLNAMWMKGMKFPLDILFLDRDKKIISIAGNLAPCTETDCPQYRSEPPAAFVLEVKAGVSGRDHLEAGQSCRWDDEAEIYRASARE